MLPFCAVPKSPIRPVPALSQVANAMLQTVTLSTPSHTLMESTDCMSVSGNYSKQTSGHMEESYDFGCDNADQCTLWGCFVVWS